jgi:hypothetical protein
MNDKPKPNAFEVLDEISHHAAEAAVERRRGTSTARDRRWSRELGAQLDERLAALRRGLIPADPPIERVKPVRPSTLALARDAVLEGIRRFTAPTGGRVQFAYRNLKRLSDDDLRRIYDTLDPTNRD